MTFCDMVLMLVTLGTFCKNEACSYTSLSLTAVADVIIIGSLVPSVDQHAKGGECQSRELTVR